MPSYSFSERTRMFFVLIPFLACFINHRPLVTLIVQSYVNKTQGPPEICCLFFPFLIFWNPKNYCLFLFMFEITYCVATLFCMLGICCTVFCRGLPRGWGCRSCPCCNVWLQLCPWELLPPRRAFLAASDLCQISFGE